MSPQIDVPAHLTKVIKSGDKIGRWQLVKNVLNDELVSWLNEHAPGYQVYYALPFPLITVKTIEQHALLKLTWCIG